MEIRFSEYTFSAGGCKREQNQVLTVEIGGTLCGKIATLERADGAEGSENRGGIRNSLKDQRFPCKGSTARTEV